MHIVGIDWEYKNSAWWWNCYCLKCSIGGHKNCRKKGENGEFRWTRFLALWLGFFFSLL